MKQSLLWRGALSILFVVFLSTGWGQITTFSYTGGAQTYTVPPGVTSIQIESWGAQGGASYACGGPVDDDGGLGGYSIGNLAVTPGEILNIYVGGKPTTLIGGGTGAGGFNGGGNCGEWAGGGGGASDVRQSGASLFDRVIVGAGGGGGNTGCPNHGTGGAGGGLLGNNGIAHTGYSIGYGGTAVSGGSGGGGAASGYFGQGGNGSGYHRAGGGGGWYGGGGGYAAGAGGGSSYLDGVTSASTAAGLRVGHGQIIIEVLCDGLVPDISAVEVCEGEEVTLSAVSTNGGTVTWDGGVTDGIAFEPPVGLNTYNATSDNDDDCAYTIDILVNPTPVVTLSASSLVICDGETVTFTSGGDADTYTFDPIDVVDGDPYSPADLGTATYT
ncbi:MAG: hypothetical protein GQ574_18905, partial [Crocinitomix sp.]|nr:hypothetical protein [Crocinitomix sp.]